MKHGFRVMRPKRDVVSWLLMGLIVVAIFVTILSISGCQWATSERGYEPVPIITHHKTPSKRYFKIRMRDGTVRYGWQDADGQLHIRKEAER